MELVCNQAGLLQASCGCAPPACCPSSPPCPEGLCDPSPLSRYCTSNGQQYAGWQTGANQTLALVGRALIIQLWRGRDAWNLDQQPQIHRVWASESLLSMRSWDGNAPASNFKNVGAGLVLGTDWSPGASWTLGILGGYTAGRQHWETLSGEGKSHAFALGFYGAWSNGAHRDNRNGWYANLVGYGAAIRGVLDRMPLCQSMSTSLHGPAFAGTLEVGYRFYSEELHWQPFASISPSWFRRHSFHEECGDPALRMCGPSHLSWKPACGAGIRFATQTTSRSGIVTSPEFILEFVQQLTNVTSCVDVGLCDTDTISRACGPPSPWTALYLGIGLFFRFSEHWHARIRVNSEHGEGMQRLTAIAQASVAF
ncbi:MAG: autotransporter outer membrane beta-barrel domain-containing protein [Chlamydiia bacterium]